MQETPRLVWLADRVASLDLQHGFVVDIPSGMAMLTGSPLQTLLQLPGLKQGRVDQCAHNHGPTRRALQMTYMNLTLTPETLACCPGDT